MAYIKDPKKDIAKLMYYAKERKVVKKVQNMIGVWLLNGTEPTYEEEVKEKSIEYQIPFADLLEVFLTGNIDVPDLETGFAKRLWLKGREDFSIDGYRKEWQKPLHFVYGQDDGKEQQVLDEKWITGFAEEICAKREQHIRWSCSMEKEEQGYLVYITGEWEEMKVPLVIHISPLVYHAAKPEKQKDCSQSFFVEEVCSISAFSG